MHTGRRHTEYIRGMMRNITGMRGARNVNEEEEEEKDDSFLLYVSD